MGAPIFQARFEVIGVDELGGGVFRLTGNIFDSSGAGFGPVDAAVNDLVFDEDTSVYIGTVNRWKVTQIDSTGPGTAIVLRVIYDESGSPGGLGTPMGGSSAICRPTVGALKLSQTPAQGWTQISETLSTAVRNTDGRFTGAAGIQGPQGFGAQGPQGTLGVDGVQGGQGWQGIGTNGVQGAQGFQGIGAQGFQGWQGIGTNGTQGAQGNQGDQGKQGFQGGPAEVMVFKGNITQNSDFPATPANGDFYHVTTSVTDPYHGSKSFIANDEIVYSSTDVDWVLVGNSLLGPQGWQGPLGYQGPQGYRGFQGLEGFQGRQGWQGLKGDASTEVGPQGSQGWQGTSIQGSQGNQGFQGWQGTGVQGPQGFQGLAGSQGNQGWQGFKGDASTEVGPQGNQGRQGWQGLAGSQGSQGWQGSGVQGPQGWQGLAGSQGNQGFQGFQDAVGRQGNQGSQGGLGPQGLQGFQGNQGWQGTGVQGPQGPQGWQGFQGWQGTGVQGVQGPQGWQGFQGNQGWQGVYGGLTLDYSFSTATGAPPADGTVRFNNADPSLVTTVYIEDTDRGGVEMDAVLDTISTNDRIRVFQANDLTKFATYRVTTNTDSGDYHTLVVTHVGSNSVIGNNAQIGVGWGLAGFQGAQGPQGWQGFQGWQGWQGLTGPQGFQGRQGWQGTGVQGPQGLAGAQGNQGRQGWQGPGILGDGIAKLTVGTTEPTGPSTGDLWVDTN